GEQHALLHQRGQAHEFLVQAAGSELAVEVHGVLTDQEHQHAVGLGVLFEAAQHRVEPFGVEVDECRATDVQTQGPRERAGGAGGATGPDVVRADDVPAAQPALIAHPGHRRADLLIRCLADTVDTGPFLTAFVQGGVRIRDAALGHRSDALPHGGDVPAGQGIDTSLVDERADLASHVLGRLAGVDDLVLDGPAQHSGGAVDLLLEHLRNRFAGRAENTAGTLQRYGEADADRVVGGAWVAPATRGWDRHWHHH